MARKAVILFNMGGIYSLNDIKPFLSKMFNDPAILDIPNPARYILAWFIIRKRYKKTLEIYSHIGGKSPILDITKSQATALQKKLNDNEFEENYDEYKVFISMRYSTPFSDDIAKEVAEYQPQEIILLPLYPQYSTTTTASSFDDWQVISEKHHLNDVKVKKIKSYATNKSFIVGYVRQIMPCYFAATKYGSPRILFSAHGIPMNKVYRGDPYPYEIEKSVNDIIKLMDNPDFAICYQSKIGGNKWTSPSIDDEIKRAAEDNLPVVIVPISFVSENSETLVELDITYKKMAEKEGIPFYIRVPTLGSSDDYIDCLFNLVKES